jgi:hypothetical protein
MVAFRRPGVGATPTSGGGSYSGRAAFAVHLARRRIPDDVRAPLPGPFRLQVGQDSPDAHNGLRPTAGGRPAPECRWSRNLRGQLLGSPPRVCNSNSVKARNSFRCRHGGQDVRTISNTLAVPTVSPAPARGEKTESETVVRDLEHAKRPRTHRRPGLPSPVGPPSGRGGKDVRDSATHPLAPLGEILTTSRHFADCPTGAALLWCI